MKREYDKSIASIRMIATVMVVILHISQQMESLVPQIRVFTDFLNISMTLFFCITAHIYTKRFIQKKSSWFLNRYIEIALPSFILGLIVVLPAFFTAKISNETAIQSLLSTLGFQSFVTNSWKFVHLWFLSCILCCYLLLLLIQKIDFKNLSGISFILAIVTPTFLLQLIFSLAKYYFSIPLPAAHAISRFYIAYAVLKRYDIHKAALKKIINALSILCLPAILLTVFVRYIHPFEGESFISSLSELIYIYTTILIGYLVYYYLYLCFEKLKSDKFLKILSYSDKISYPVYLTHCHFILYNTSFIFKFNNVVIGIIISMLLTLISSFLLYYVSLPIKNMIKKLIK